MRWFQFRSFVIGWTVCLFIFGIGAVVQADEFFPLVPNGAPVFVVPETFSPPAPHKCFQAFMPYQLRDGRIVWACQLNNGQRGPSGVGVFEIQPDGSQRVLLTPNITAGNPSLEFIGGELYVGFFNVTQQRGYLNVVPR